jgi:hypothetical protein
MTAEILMALSDAAKKATDKLFAVERAIEQAKAEWSAIFCSYSTDDLTEAAQKKRNHGAATDILIVTAK